MVRNIFVTVDQYGETGITESQYAGVQGEHNLCEVSFDVTALEGNDYAYRGEFVDGNGWGYTTDILTPVTESGVTSVSFLFPGAWTAAGGKGVARLVASKVVDNVETERVYVIDVSVYFKSKQEVDPQAGRDTFAGLTSLIDSVHGAIDDAGTATSAANTAAGYANTQGSYANGRGLYAQGQGDYAKSQGDYAKDQGDYAKEQGDAAKDAEADLRAAAAAGDFDGADGGYYSPSVNAAGDLSWTASDPDMPAVTGANIKGPQGDTGSTGPQGPQGVGLVDVTNVIVSGTAQFGYTYNMYLDFGSDNAPTQIMFAGYIAYGIGENDRVSLWDKNGVNFIATSEGDLTAESGEHLFVFDQTNTVWIVKGDPGKDAVVDPTLSVEGEAADAKAVGDALESKANVDGHYDGLTAGYAEQLVSSVYTTEKKPYFFRTAGGGIDIGSLANDTIAGGTVSWNQLAKNGDFSSKSNWTAYNSSYSVSDNEATVTKTGGGSGSIFQDISAASGDKLLLTCFAKVGTGTKAELYGQIGSGTSKTTTSSSFSRLSMVVAAISGTNRVQLRAYGDNGQTAVFKSVQFFNLTKMFGSAIADYVYSLEQGNVDAGVAWFRKLFPKDYYAYNAGELMSVKTSAHKTVGFNAYNHATGQAKLVGGHQYQITGTYTALSFETYTVTPDEDGYFTVNKDGVLYVNGGNNTDTCVHLVWDGERDGEWAPYTEHIYPLDADLELRGIPKLDENNNPYYDGDLYESDGTVTRNYEYRNYSAGDESLTDAITDGTHTVAKLVTPTTETADPFADPQIVDDFGTEEYVDSRTVPIPVGHITKYQNNLRAKLEMAPNSPDGDGDYIVRQVNGVNTYVPLPAQAADYAIMVTIDIVSGNMQVDKTPEQVAEAINDGRRIWADMYIEQNGENTTYYGGAYAIPGSLSGQGGLYNLSAPPITGFFNDAITFISLIPHDRGDNDWYYHVVICNVALI